MGDGGGWLRRGGMLLRSTLISLFARSALYSFNTFGWKLLGRRRLFEKNDFKHLDKLYIKISIHLIFSSWNEYHARKFLPWKMDLLPIFHNCFSKFLHKALSEIFVQIGFKFTVVKLGLSREVLFVSSSTREFLTRVSVAENLWNPNFPLKFRASFFFIYIFRVFLFP